MLGSLRLPSPLAPLEDSLISQSHQFLRHEAYVTLLVVVLLMIESCMNQYILCTISIITVIPRVLLRSHAGFLSSTAPRLFDSNRGLSEMGFGFALI